MFRVHAPLWALTITATSFAAQPTLTVAPPLTVEEGSTAKLGATVESYKKWRAEINAQVQAAGSPEAAHKAYASADWSSFTAAFREIAYSSDGNETAAEAWVWVVRCGKDFAVEDAREAIENLVAAHVDSKAIAGLVRELEYAEGLDPAFVEQSLNTIAEKSPAEGVQVAARFAIVNSLIRGGDGPKAKRDRARELLVGMQASVDEVSLANHNIERALFEVDNLQIGMQAPDFEAVDADGVSFKLSDYRGKVVVVDFWGFW